jgi:hypothetical protein
MIKMSEDYRSVGYRVVFEGRNPQHRDLISVADELIARAGGIEQFASRTGKTIRRAFDEVIDMPRTGRWELDQLEKTEKTYIGTKVEIIFRHEFEWPKGEKLDLKIGDREVDVKNTVSGNWSIPEEAVDEVCLLLSGNDTTNLFCTGLFRAHERYLNPGKNKDSKRTISMDGREAIFWVVRDKAMPENFMTSLDETTRTALLTSRYGAERVRQLFTLVTSRAIHRSVVEGIAQQKDPMKRVRANGGARDKLLQKGLLILSGKHNMPLIQELGYTGLTAEHFITVPAVEIVQKLGEPRAAEVIETFKKVVAGEQK